MAKYELPIYGENDEIVKTYTSNICPWGVFVQAAALQEKLSTMGAVEQMNAVGDLLKSVFANLTDAELARADITDVMSTFKQITNAGTKIKGNSKNA